MDKKEIYERVTSLLNDDSVSDKVVSKKLGELIEHQRICNNFWCKCIFTVKIHDGDELPKTCPKCDSFNYELSDGVESGERHYDGPRQDGMAHEVEFHFSKYKNGKGFWDK